MNEKKDERIDSRMKYIRQKIMFMLRTGPSHEYQTSIGMELDKLNNNLESKLNDTKDKMMFELEKNSDRQSVTSMKTSYDLQIMNSSDF